MRRTGVDVTEHVSNFARALAVTALARTGAVRGRTTARYRPALGALAPQLLAAAVLLAACNVDHGELPPVSNPSEGVFAGVVQDEEGQPVAGALVSVDGIEAEAPTDGKGRFVVRAPELATGGSGGGATAFAAVAGGSGPPREVAVLAPGFDTHLSGLRVREGERAVVQIARSRVEFELEVTTPSGRRLHLVRRGCNAPALRLQGWLRRRARPSARLDVVIAIDRSGSTGRPAFDLDGDGEPDSVLAAEIEAARCFVGRLDARTARVAVVAFGDAAEVVVPFTRDLAAVDAALAALGEPAGGTNYEAAFVAARQLFQALAEADDLADRAHEPGGGRAGPPQRGVVFLSDGIPTAHGVPRDVSDSNLSQSREDREAAIRSARELGEATAAELHAWSIVSLDDTNRKRTTLPHCVAAAGGGSYHELHAAEELPAALCADALLPPLVLRARNRTTGRPARAAVLGPGGRFAVELELAWSAGVPLDNEIVLELEITAGRHRRTVERTVRVRALEEDAYLALDAESAFDEQLASEPPAELGALQRPEGGPLANDRLFRWLGAEFADARVLHGSAGIVAVGGGGDALVSLRVDAVARQGCVDGDLGVLTFDPAAPPRDAAEALAGLDAQSVLWHTAEWEGGGCTDASLPAGAWSRELEVPRGHAVVFFFLPGRTLADYQADPEAGPPPLFSLPELNPGGFAQAIALRSTRGRTGAGDRDTVLAPGPGLVMCFEDRPAAEGAEGEWDFNDLVLYVRGTVAPLVRTVGCGR
ncbi:MAG: hypothetical protein KatS3mg102_2279 [Planctomycetota bacterium]|nr:MAG: hypothetical protein KatS3mg102_2279 [Planctomycetota bacterium]